MVPPLSTTSFWSSMRSTTGAGGGVELARVGTLETGERTGRLDDHDLEPEAEPEQGQLVLAGVVAAAILPSTRARRTTRDDQAVEAAQAVVVSSRGRGRLDPLDLHFRPWWKPACRRDSTTDR